MDAYNIQNPITRVTVYTLETQTTPYSRIETGMKAQGFHINPIPRSREKGKSTQT